MVLGPYAPDTHAKLGFRSRECVYPPSQRATTIDTGEAGSKSRNRIVLSTAARACHVEGVVGKQGCLSQNKGETMSCPRANDVTVGKGIKYAERRPQLQ